MLDMTCLATTRHFILQSDLRNTASFAFAWEFQHYLNINYAVSAFGANKPKDHSGSAIVKQRGAE
jgi:hypothetical protein